MELPGLRQELDLQLLGEVFLAGLHGHGRLVSQRSFEHLAEVALRRGEAERRVRRDMGLQVVRDTRTSPDWWRHMAAIDRMTDTHEVHLNEECFFTMLGETLSNK